MDDLILETRGLTKEFRGFTAVHRVDLKIRRGTIHALIGPNGAGKTTCFNLLTKFLQPTRGRIAFKGQDITGLPPTEIARLGLVRSFQISAVFPHLTALENVRVALQRQHGQSFDFEFWPQDHPMFEHRHGHRLDIIRRNEIPSRQRGVGSRSHHQRLGRAGTGATIGGRSGRACPLSSVGRAGDS